MTFLQNLPICMFYKPNFLRFFAFLFLVRFYRIFRMKGGCENLSRFLWAQNESSFLPFALTNDGKMIKHSRFDKICAHRQYDFCKFILRELQKKGTTLSDSALILKDYFERASATATATATVAPTMGLLPMPRKPIISTCAGTEEEPAN